MIKEEIERCAGIDVGKKYLSVTIMVGPLARGGTARRKAHVWHDSSRTGKVARMVAKGKGHARGDGEYRLVLEAGLERTGRIGEGVHRQSDRSQESERA